MFWSTIIGFTRNNSRTLTSAKNNWARAVRPEPGTTGNEDEKAKHGPYCVWTRKVKGKTVTRTLTAEQAQLCKRCIEAMRELQKTIKTLKDLTVRYIENQK